MNKKSTHTIKLQQENNEHEKQLLQLRKKLQQKNMEIFHLKSILDSLPGSVYWKDKNGIYLGRNSYSIEKMESVGLEKNTNPDNIAGKTDYNIFPKEVADRYREHDLKVLKFGKEISSEEPVTLPNGKTLIQLSTKRPLRDENGTIIGVIGNTVDITYQKKIEAALIKAKEQAENAARVKTNFIRNMEHDIRTPFSGIWGIANYLWEHEEEETKKELLGEVTQSAKQLLDYCNGILDFAKTESGALPVLEKKFNLKDLLDNTIIAEKPAARHKKLELLFKQTNDLPTFVIGDAYRLSRILINLVSNAIKFTENGKITVEIKRVKGAGDCLIQFIIADTGIGISKEQHDFIFEKFSKLSPSSKGKYRGLGLGLRVVKQFVYEMEGEIDLKSKPNQGTTFACTIPFKLPLTEEHV